MCERSSNSSHYNNLFFLGRPIYAELSPVTDFREACCRQHEISECNRGGFCNFMHLKHPSRQLRRELYEGQRMDIREKRREEMRHEEEERGPRDRDLERSEFKSPADVPDFKQERAEFKQEYKQEY
jgi:splicing factor U2AF subunit